VAQQKDATTAQLALAWLLAKKPWIVPIPGTTKLNRVDGNIGATTLTLEPETLRRIDESAGMILIQGARLPEAVLKLSDV
jgi:aryl-alcohol dehydrogenase-like predicted oxidoreductase